MIFVFLSAPVRPKGSETKEQNLAIAKLYYLKLCQEHPDHVFLMPWLVNCEVFAETPEDIAKGMERSRAVIVLLGQYESLTSPAENSVDPFGDDVAQLWLVGPRVADGMRDEALYALSQGLTVMRVFTASWLDHRIPEGVLIVRKPQVWDPDWVPPSKEEIEHEFFKLSRS